MIVSVPKLSIVMFSRKFECRQILDRCSAFICQLCLPKGTLHYHNNSKANTSFSYVIGLKHVFMLKGLFHRIPYIKKKLSLNFFMLNIHFRRCVNGCKRRKKKKIIDRRNAIYLCWSILKFSLYVVNFILF